MGFHAARLRRALPLCSTLIHGNLHTPKSIPPIRSIAATISAASNPSTAGTSPLAGLQSCRMFRSSPVALSARRQRYDNESEITEDTILFEGCDYNHWLITVDFPKGTPAEDKIATYERIAAQAFGSIEVAKKNIYACSTTVYDGFQVLCTEDFSKKFEVIPEVVFVLPDSYIDPVNKQYGGDKYINGEIIHMPPPVNYMKRDNPRPRQYNDNRGYDNRGQREFGPPRQQQNFGPPQNIPHQQQQNFPHQQNVPPQQQNFGPPSNVPRQQQNQNFGPPQHSPPRQQNFGAPQHSQPQQQNFGPPQHSQPQQRNFGPPQNFQNHQNFGPPQNQNHGYPPNPPHEQHIGAPQSPSFGHNSSPQRGAVPQQSYDFPQNAPPQQQTYPGHVEDQKFSRVG